MSDNANSSADLVFYGFVVDREKNAVSIQVAPGAVVQLQTSDIESIEEATDPGTKRVYVRAVLKPDAEFTAKVTPKLARLAVEVEGVPFALGGSAFFAERAEDLPPGTAEGITHAAALAAPAGGGLPADCKNTTLNTREVATRCRRHFFGWINCDRRVITYYTCDDAVVLS